MQILESSFWDESNDWFSRNERMLTLITTEELRCCERILEPCKVQLQTLRRSHLGGKMGVHNIPLPLESISVVEWPCPPFIKFGSFFIKSQIASQPDPAKFVTILTARVYHPWAVENNISGLVVGDQPPLP